MLTATIDRFADARRAITSADFEKYSEALEAEMREDPVRARDIAEFSCLRLFKGVCDENSAARQMLEKAIDVLVKITPMLIFNPSEKGLTLRALNIAEATCEWTTDDRPAEKIEHAKAVVQSTPPSIAFADAIRAGIISENQAPALQAPVL